MKKGVKFFFRNLIINGIRLTTRLNTNQVFFSSFSGTYSDNLKPISEELHRLSPSTKIIWSIQKEKCNGLISSIPSYIVCIDKNDKVRFNRAVSSSKVWVSNYSFPFIKKRSNQFFIQTWHGDKGFKVCLKDAAGANEIFSESIDGYCNLAVAGSDFGEQMYRNAFPYNGEILKIGTPRNDRLVKFSAKEAQIIRDKLGLSGKKILLYAPTFRNEYQNTGCPQKIEQIDLHSIMRLLEKKTNEEWVCLLRAHPAIATLTGVEYGEKIIDVTMIEDMADLLLISDILITDYSSCAGDFALLRRPIILFQNDRNRYIENDRAFRFDLESSPYYIAQNQNELEQILKTHSSEDYYDNCNQILDFYGNHESGKASNTIAKIIANRLEKTSSETNW